MLYFMSTKRGDQYLICLHFDLNNYFISLKSKFATDNAFSFNKFRLGSTSSPIKVVKFDPQPQHLYRYLQHSTIIGIHGRFKAVPDLITCLYSAGMLYPRFVY